jgi:hypothetical protein
MFGVYLCVINLLLKVVFEFALLDFIGLPQLFNDVLIVLTGELLGVACTDKLSYFSEMLPAFFKRGSAIVVVSD